MELIAVYGGGTVGYSTGDPLRLLEDAQIIKPHIMPGVPRVWNRYVLAIVATMDSMTNAIRRMKRV